VDVPFVDADHVGEEDPLEFVDEQAAADGLQQLQDGVPRVVLGVVCQVLKEF
jgi:X-X-X-Leu-X-X-Gly heptad repeat protein